MNFSEKNAAKVFKNILKRAKKNVPYGKLQFAFFDDTRKYCCSDSFIAIRLNAPVPDVPDDAGKPFAIEKVFPNDIADYKPIELPSLSDVKAMIAEDKGKKEKLYTFGTSEDGTSLPVVQLQFLKEVLEIFPDAKAFYRDALKPFYVSSEHGDALICPVRPNGKIDTSRQRAPLSVNKKPEKIPFFSFETLLKMYAA